VTERLREPILKLIACVLPTTVLVGVLFLLGGKGAAIATLVFGELAAVAIATTMRPVRGSIVAGWLLAVGLVAMLLFFAYVREA
jgi:hypothetical protein